jgi:hypothetical protein
VATTHPGRDDLDRGPDNRSLPGPIGARGLVRQAVPGLMLPGATYLAVRPHTSTLVALAAASSAPALDVLWHLVRRRRPAPAGLAFLASAGVSVALGLGLRSPLVMLAKGVVVSGAMSLAFAVSAAVRRPLTRTLAIALFAAHHELARRTLAERWGHPRALAVFRALSLGWAGLLLLSALQQAVLVVTAPPGAVVVAEPVIQLGFTAAGTAVSVAYVRRRHRAHPDLGLLPVSAAG